MRSKSKNKQTQGMESRSKLKKLFCTRTNSDHDSTQGMRSRSKVEGHGGGIRGGIGAGGEGLGEIVGDGIGGAEKKGDLRKGGTA